MLMSQEVGNFSGLFFFAQPSLPHKLFLTSSIFYIKNEFNFQNHPPLINPMIRRLPCDSCE